MGVQTFLSAPEHVRNSRSVGLRIAATCRHDQYRGRVSLKSPLPRERFFVLDWRCSGERVRVRGLVKKLAKPPHPVPLPRVKSTSNRVRLAGGEGACRGMIPRMDHRTEHQFRKRSRSCIRDP